MRGMYTSGVLDAFMENGLFINNIYAVSAGCYNALSYLSRQPGRTIRINLKYLRDKRYINMKKLITRGSAINTSFIFDDVFKNLDPFEYDDFKKYCGNFYAVCTDCNTGEAVYAKVKDLDKDVEYVKASAALPVFAKLVEVDGLVLTDGGPSDSIPIKKSIEDGYLNNIVVLTRPEGYVMHESKYLGLCKMKYKKYPNLIKTLENRPQVYNETLRLIERLEKNGKIIVIRPKESLNISNLEKNEEKIKQIYKMGYEDGIAKINEIKKFIKGPENEIKKTKRV